MCATRESCSWSVVVEAGAYGVDTPLAGHGAGAGNTAIEAFTAVANL